MMNHDDFIRQHVVGDQITPFTNAGTCMSIAANRISYHFDLQGVSLATDTACSSSLVALHLARRALLNRESSTALCGGVNALMLPGLFIALTKLRMLSPDGRCKAFDASANGYVRSEGCGFVVLKPLHAAQETNDRCYAIVRGSALNSDGRSAIPITAPSVQSQRANLISAYKCANIEPQMVQFVEAHGTGTQKGDLAEATALADVMGTHGRLDNPLLLGSVKTNIGHTESASGIAGLMKAILCLHHVQIPRNLHFDTPNPTIDFRGLHVVDQHLSEWPRAKSTRRELMTVGVNSFGFGGTNAHVVLQSAALAVPADSAAQKDSSIYCLPLSAKTASSLIKCAASMATFLDDSRHVSLEDICYTTALRRTHHAHRLAVTGECRSDLCAALSDFTSTADALGANQQHCSRGIVNENAPPRLAFVFSGQGSHWAGMGVRLANTCKVFQAELMRVDDMLQPLCGFSVAEELRRFDAANLTHPNIVQPAIFAIQVGVVAVLKSWGVVPTAVIGHSVGEVAAAYCAGALTLSQACQIIAVRSNLCQKVSTCGGMIAAKIPATRAEQELRDIDAEDVEIAAFNSRTSVTFTGSTDAIELMAAALDKRSVPHKLLDICGAFHSRFMDPIKAQLEEQLRDLKPTRCRVPFFSTVTADEVQGPKLDAGYWWSNVRKPVLFHDTVSQVRSFGCDGFLEIGPNGILQRYLKEELPLPNWHMPTLMKPRDDSEIGRNDGLVHTFAQLFCRGVDCRWEAIYRHGATITCPAYQFDRHLCWVDLHVARPTASLQELDLQGMTGLDACVSDQQTVVVQIARTGWLHDHVIQSKIVVPGTAFVEIALAAANQLFSSKSDTRGSNFYITNLKWVSPVFLDATDATAVSVDVQMSSANSHPCSWNVSISETTAAKRSEPRQLTHATLHNQSTEWPDSVHNFADLQSKMPDQAAGTLHLSSDEVYDRFARIGLRYTGLFRAIDSMWINGQSGTSVARICSIGYDGGSYVFHPALLDSILQSMSGALDLRTPLFPVEVESIRLRRAFHSAEVWTHSQLTESHDSYVIGNIVAYDDTGMPLVEIIGFKVQLLGSQVGNSPAVQSLMYRTRWHAQPLPEIKVTTQKHGWTVFLPRNPLVPQLVQTVLHGLRERGLLCGIITFGEQFSCRDDEWTVRPDHGEDIAQVISELDRQAIPSAGTVNLCALETLTEPLEKPGVMERIQQESCMPLIHLHQTYAVQKQKRAIVTVKFGGPSTSQDQDMRMQSLAQSFLDGIVRTSMLESTNVHCHAVNLSTGSAAEGSSLLRELMHCAEVVCADEELTQVAEFEVALEEDKRVVPRVERESTLVAKHVTAVEANHTYVIVGGLGGLGLTVSQWLLRLGVDSLVLTTRSGGSTTALQTLDELRQSHPHARIVVMRSDASDYSDLAAMIDKCKELSSAIKGVFLCTMQLADAYIEAQTSDTVRLAMAAKMDAAWNLHVATLGLRLDFFILFSSVSGLIGNRGQANYAAGNTFLDALALFRRQQNLPATSINWGPIGGAGYLAKDQDRLVENLGKQGMRPVSLELLLQALNQLVGQEQLVQVGCIDIDWATYLRANYTGRARAILPARLASIEDTVVLGGPAISNATPSDSRSVEEQLGSIVSQILGIDQEATVTSETSLVSYGLDSLMSSELKLMIESNWNVAVPISNILQGASIRDLANLIGGRDDPSRGAGHPAAEANDSPVVTIDPIDDSSGPNEDLIDDSPSSYSYKIPNPLQSPRLIIRSPRFAHVVASPDEILQPFAMNDLQFAYYIGRSGAFGAAVPCHFYFEFDREHEELDAVQLERAFNNLIARHEVLRSVVVDGMFVIKQSVPTYHFAVVNLEDHDGQTDSKLEKLRQKYSLEQFDPAQWPLFSVGITKTPRFSRIHVNIDHIILDIKATLSLFAEWAHCYYYPQKKLPNIGFSYRDYSLASGQYKSSEHISAAKAYWMARLHQLPPAPPLPKSLANTSAEARSVFVRRTAILGSEPWSRLKRFAAQHNATAANILCTAFCLVLARWSACYCFTINVPVFSKLPVHENVESVLGDFTSSILLQCDLQLASDFKTCVQTIQRQMSSDLDHVDFSGVAVLRELSRLSVRSETSSDTTAASGSMTSMPVVFTSIIDSNAGDSYGWLGRNVYGISETPQVELDGHVYTMGKELAVNFDFIEARYPPGMVDDMFESYMQLLMTLSADEASWVTKDLQMLPPLQQVERINANSLHSNETQKDSAQSLVHAILPAMEANKLAIALTSGDVQLNYAQLLSTAAELCASAELRKLPPKSTVAIIMHKGWEQIVAVLASLLLGAAYVPLDAALPHSRVSKLLAQCKAKAIFVQDDCRDWPIPTVGIDAGVICEPLSWTSDKDWLTTCRELLPRWSSVQTHDLAYVLFTSGTTGVPKGVMVEHASVLNTVNFVNGHFQVSSSDVFFGLSQLSFDLSVYDIFGSWLAGAHLVLPLENQVKDPTHWMSLVTQHQVSVWNSVPALMAWKLDSMEWSDKQPMAPSEMSSLRLVLLSGDRIPAALPARIRACFDNATVVSLGGPTEDTVWSIINEQVDELSPGGLIPYGVPISGMDAHVIDAMENDCPVWTVGEICFSGVGVARGYFENPELTAASFSLHPVTGDRMHRTGDIGRYLPGGKIEIIGRKDFQVKVRGFRIELEEIETVGQSVDGIQEAAVVPIRDDKSNQNYTGLVMYYTTPKPSKKATIVKRSDSEAIAFKCARLGERRDLGSAIALKRVPTQAAQKIAQGRRTWRAFTTLPLLLANFESDVVKALREACTCSTAGIQYLLYARNGGIAGVPSGFYQMSENFSLGDESTLFSTVEHLPADTVFGENESIFHRSSGAIFMLQSASVHMSLIEAGRVGHRLMQNVASEDAGVGFCPIGAVDVSALSACLPSGLGANRVIHTMCFGPVSPSSSDNSARLTASQAREQQLRAHLSSELPQYMVPRSFVELETMPLTKNGKVDRQALEVLYQSTDGNQAAPDQSAAHAGDSVGDLTQVSPAEAELLGIWTQRLKGATSITPTDDFLALGGDSLVALQIIVDARAKGLLFSVTDLFTARTIRNMAQTDVAQQFNADRAQISNATSMKMKHALPQLLKDPASKFEPFRLTPVQQAYWVGRHSEMNLGNTSTHGFLEWKVANFKLERLQSALVSLVERHEMLRAIIRKDGLQQVLPMSHETFPNVNVIDLTQYRKEESMRRLVETRNRLSHEIFEPSEWPLFSVSAITVSGGDCFVGFSYDMLVFDVRSIFMFVDQLFQIYHGRQEVYNQPQISFREYTEALERWKEKSDDYRKSIQFWRQTFVEHRPCGPDLPLALRPEDIEQPRFLRKELCFPASMWTSFGEKATSNGLTASAALLSLFGLVVRQWCSDQGRPFCINVPVSSRLPIHADVDRLIGDFTTTIFITFDGSNTLFLNQARAITEQLMERIEHRHVSGIEVLRDLSAGDPVVMSEMAVPVVFTSALDISLDTHSDVEFSYGVSQTSQVWLDCQVYAEKDHVVMNWDYVSGLFAPGLVETMAELFLSSVDELSNSSSWDLLKISNGTRMPTVDTDVDSATAAQGNQLLHSAFVHNAMADGERPAVISGTGTMITYQQLLDRATVIHDWVAQHVSQRQEEQCKLVGVVTNKGWEEVVAVLGVLCAGGAYIPISASLPPNRIRQLLKLSEASCVLTHSEVRSKLGFLDTVAPTLCIDTIDYSSVSKQSRDHIITSGNATSLAYVIFTSGSTGVPKGVMIQHCAAINTIEDINRRFRVDSTDRAFGISSLSFDLSVWDIFGILGCGGCLVLPSVDAERDPTQWVECIQEHGVTIWNSVPQLLGMLVEHVDHTGDAVNSLSSLRLALLSGDWIPVGLPDAIRAVTSDKVSVISLGGATEASIWSVVYPIGEVDPSWKSIPYGRALANQRIYCLNENLEPALPWVRGELYIAGAGLAVGYWKAPDLTAKQFIYHPATGERLYKTGDVGRLANTGDIEFLGRMDSQVKLAGFRVELGEIEAILHGHPQVVHAVALVVDISSSQALVAAVVPTAGVHDDVDEELRSFVKTRLPSYMVPRAVVILDSLPLTKNGKVDNKQLEMRVRQVIEVTTPEDDLVSAPEDGSAPRGASSRVVDPVVSKILKIWEEVLNIPVGPNSDFFTDLSGASAAAIQLINTVNANLNTNMAVAKLFSHPTPVLQAELIRQGGGCESITPIVDLAPSSRAPHRVYCIHPAGGSSLCYARAARILEKDLHLYGVDDLHSAEQFSQYSGTLDNSIGLHEQDTDSRAAEELPVKELARRYAKFVLDHAEGEPFALAGFSLGGIIAWEVASHLCELGVDKLVGVSLIDTSTESEPTMTDEKILGSLVAHYRRSAGQDVDALDESSIGSQNQDDLCRHVAARMEAAGMYPHGVGFVALKRFLALFHRHIKMIGNYTSPSTLEIPAVFVSGLDSSTQQREFWSRLCANVGGLMHTAVPCCHDEMLSERHSTISVGCCAQFFTSNVQDAGQQAQKVELKKLVIQCLNVDIDPEQISDGTNLWTLGANSVFYVKLQRRLKADLGVDVRLPALLAAQRFCDLSAVTTPRTTTEGSLPEEASREHRFAPSPKQDPKQDEPATDTGSVAIIGMSCRFPGDASSPEEFWDNLINAVDCISMFSSNFSTNSNWVGASGLVNGQWMDCFDCQLFQMTRKESSLMDPQHRLFLELGWEALEQSGLRGREESIGVWSSFAPNTYLQSLLKQETVSEPTATTDMLQLLLANERDYASARMSYLLDLRGPSMNVQTACSSSLVAISLAHGSLNRGECAAAVVGAVSLAFPMRRGYTWEHGGIFSKRGRCAAFDASADGTVPGFGGASVVLRSLATVDHSTQAKQFAVRAVIRGAAVNHDGRRKPGLTAPSMEAQLEVLRAAFVSAELSPSTLGMVEAHGTGTVLGDPIEGTALIHLLNSATGDSPRSVPVALGSVKSNIGHLDAAAGLAGLVKVALALEKSRIPPTLHVSNPNPSISWGTQLAPVLKARDWPGIQATAGVSSFGMSGTNAHIVLQQYQQHDDTPLEDDAPQSVETACLLTLSAATEVSLLQSVEKLCHWRKDNADAIVANVALTLKRRHEHRLGYQAVAVTSSGRLLSSTDFIVNQSSVVDVIFLFPGQGTQSLGHAASMYSCNACFRLQVQKCCELLCAQEEWHAVGTSVLYAIEHGATSGLIGQADQQACVFVVNYAMAQVWMQFGVTPTYVCGHSLGDLVACCVSGAVELEDMLLLIAKRGQLVDSLTETDGGMLAVRCTEEVLRAELENIDCGKKLALAAVNRQNQLVVAGLEDDVARFEYHMKGRGIAAHRLPVQHAFHTLAMETASKQLERYAKQNRQSKQTKSKGALVHISTVTGQPLQGEPTAEYFAQQLVLPVQFAAALESAFHDTPRSVEGVGGKAHRVLLEVGSSTTLTSIVNGLGTALSSLPHHSHSSADGYAHWLQTLGVLWSLGVPVKLAGLSGHDEARFMTELPAYAFDRQQLTAASQRATGETTAIPETGPQADKTEPIIEVLRTLFQDVLSLADSVDTKSDFFTLRGSSLDAVQLLNKVTSMLGVTITLSQFLQQPTVQGLYELVVVAEQQAEQQPVSSDSEPLRSTDTVYEPVSDPWQPLSFSQEAIYSTEHIYPQNDGAYNLPSAFILPVGTTTPAKLSDRLNRLVARHDALRAVFRPNGPSKATEYAPRMSIVDACTIDVEQLVVHQNDGSKHTDYQEALDRELRRFTNKPFDLQAGPLIRAAVVPKVFLSSQGMEVTVVVVVFHHLVCDGLSAGVLLGNLADTTADENEEISGSEQSYTQFIQSERRWIGTRPASAALDYWRGELDGLLQKGDTLTSTLQLMPIKPHLAESPHRESPFGRRERSFGGGTVPVSLSSGTVENLRRYASQCSVTLSAVLLGLYSLLLWRYAGRGENTLPRVIPIGIPVANRPPGFQRLVGCCMNMVVLCCDIKPDELLSSFLVDLQRKMGAAIDNSYPFTELVRRLAPPRAKGGNPLYQAVFNVRPSAQRSTAAAGRSLGQQLPYAFDSNRSQNDIGLHLLEPMQSTSGAYAEDDGCRGYLEYNDQILDRPGATELVRSFLRLAEYVATEGALSSTVMKISTLHGATSADRNLSS